MANNLVAINTANILSKQQYTDLGENADLQISYKTDGKDYLIESYYGDSYTLTGSTVDSIANSTNYTSEEVMDILYIVYDAYECVKSSIETSDPLYKQGIKKYTKKYQDKMVEIISDLLRRYSYEDVLAYLTSMPVYDLISMFNGQDAKEALDALHKELAPLTTVQTFEEPEEIVSRYFN